jgi:hypothetical protein
MPELTENKLTMRPEQVLMLPKPKQQRVEELRNEGPQMMPISTIKPSSFDQILRTSQQMPTAGF